MTSSGFLRHQGRGLAIAVLLALPTMMADQSEAAAQQITEFPLTISASMSTRLGNIAFGSDGALWFTEEFLGGVPSGNKIGRMAADGTIKEFPLADAAAPF